MNEKKGNNTLMILLTALGALAIIILFGWIAFFNPVETLEEKPQLTLSSFSSGSEPSLLPEKSAEELLLDGLQKGDEPPLMIEESNDIIIEVVPPEDKKIELPANEPAKSAPEPVQVKKPTEYKEITEVVYWLQVGSFPNSVKADELRAYLKEKGIETVLQTKDINGTLYYRVRVGAFVNKNEAESFKEKLLQLNNIDEVISFTGSLTKKVPVN